MFESLFGSVQAEKASKLLSIEKRDIAYLKATFDIIVKLEKNFTELKELVDKGDINSKAAQLSLIENNLLQIKNKIEAIQNDVNQIKNIEARVKESIALNDQVQIENKYDKLNEINSSIDDVLEVLTHQPSIDELKQQLQATLAQKINIIISNINSMVADDNHLKEVYSQISEL